jgi:hypothetical protein
LYNLHPSSPERCQYGWCLSFTPHCLRELDGATALDVFVRDLKVCASKAPSQASNSIVSILSKGGAEEPWPVRKSTSAPGRPGGIIYYFGSLDAARECLASSHEAS